MYLTLVDPNKHFEVCYPLPPRVAISDRQVRVSLYFYIRDLSHAQEDTADQNDRCLEVSDISVETINIYGSTSTSRHWKVRRYLK